MDFIVSVLLHLNSPHSEHLSQLLLPPHLPLYLLLLLHPLLGLCSVAARAEPVVDVGGEGEGEAGGVVGGGAQ